jgi:hypothetical protein
MTLKNYIRICLAKVEPARSIKYSDIESPSSSIAKHAFHHQNFPHILSNLPAHS